jgi:hypothetical protein
MTIVNGNLLRRKRPRSEFEEMTFIRHDNEANPIYVSKRPRENWQIKNWVNKKNRFPNASYFDYAPPRQGHVWTAVVHRRLPQVQGYTLNGSQVYYYSKGKWKSQRGKIRVINAC